jgi:hypothetical protein
MEAIRSSETSVHTRYTRRHIPEDGILNLFFIDSWEEFLFYFINFGALDFVQLILNADFFYYISHTICSIFQFFYALLQKTEICLNVGPVSLEQLQCFWVIK